MANYKMIIQYDGTRYKGWQRQKTTDQTIQGKIEAILSRQYGRTIEIDGSGRTDAGVHAHGQVANFRLPDACCAGKTPEELCEELRQIFVQYLPEDIAVTEVRVASERFHSRLNATGKVYEYCLCKKDGFDVFGRKYMWQMDKELDVMRMRQAAEKLVGEHDFKGFCTKASRKKSTERNLYDITITEDENRIYLTFYGSGFLYNMVRILTGTLVEIGMGERTAESIDEVFAKKERALAGVTAPAKGLTLVRVLYD